ncbi:putative sporulation protein YtxC [uncultured Clostridium sp.]|uniref:putative sporulation protein YtxC n=1 Tax=uncultured Clostridium sp. TaxID=59620 RepID=UPI002605AEE3|nr:putative sporulation protein YtxC [uncultured Clostridium sp.]
MLVLKLAYMGDLDFIKELQDLKTLLKKKEIVIGLVEQIEGETHIIKVLCEEESEEIQKKVKLYISDLLYRMVIKDYKRREMFQLIKDTYFFLKQDEILEIEVLVMETLYRENKIGDDIGLYCEEKINEIILKINECLNENNELNINGFITFRMRSLREDIEDVIDKVIQKYMVDKEYNEFIKLLKYFVEIQDSKIEKINIIIDKEGSYRIEDEGGKDIFEQFTKEIGDSKIGIDANIEDVIISGLITNAPKEVLIMGRKNCINKEFIKTVECVFNEKVIYCE